MDIWEPQRVHLSDETLRKLFFHYLEELTQGWYIALSEKSGQQSKWVLCHESEPHPHNGSTWRDQEVDLEDSRFETVRRACELLETLRRTTRAAKVTVPKVKA